MSMTTMAVCLGRQARSTDSTFSTPESVFVRVRTDQVGSADRLRQREINANIYDLLADDECKRKTTSPLAGEVGSTKSNRVGAAVAMRFRDGVSETPRTPH